ncbi:hypothetical protein SNE40_021717 [Patella caerulea]|uniref:Uncharacterized protein n=1 Tax=Patella caerulea TaxID=87958 RepID=A0AAN8IX36_PATCE
MSVEPVRYTPKSEELGVTNNAFIKDESDPVANKNSLKDNGPQNDIHNGGVGSSKDNNGSAKSKVVLAELKEDDEDHYPCKWGPISPLCCQKCLNVKVVLVALCAFSLIQVC